MDTHLRIPCEFLKQVLRIKSLSLKEEKGFELEIIKNLKEMNENLDIEKYWNKVCSKTIIDYQKLLAELKSTNFIPVNLPGLSTLDKLDSADVFLLAAKRAMYECVVALYPSLELNNICKELNIQTYDKLSAILMELTSRKSTNSKMTPRRHKLLSLLEIDALNKKLSREVIGQKTAVDITVKALKLVHSGLEDRHSMFFVGPTGVGKTMLAKSLAANFKYDFFKINCAEYSQPHETAKLIGSPPGYIGHGEKSILQSKAEVSNRWVFLFDEIEKAHSKLQDFLLSLLDDGTVTDNQGNTLDFSNSIFIFTSNQGMVDAKIGNKRIGFDKEEVKYAESKDQIWESVKTKFSPEFLNRIDNIVHFNQLTEHDARIIAKQAISGLPIKKTKALIDYIVKNGYSLEYGARNINRFVKNHIKIKIADQLLSNKVPDKGNLYNPKIVDNELVITQSVDYLSYEKSKKSKTTLA